MQKINSKAAISRWQPFCQQACPLGNHIREWLKLVKANKLNEAWRLLVSRNPLPATLGRVCYHFCEANCRRRIDDDAVAVSCVERWLGDQALKHHWPLNAPINNLGASAKRVLIVGAGPAGLSAAYQLAHLGHSVTIIEQEAYAGGELVRTLPTYRLPLNVIQAEIARITSYPNIAFKFNEKWSANSLTKVPPSFDAMILATGAKVDRTFQVPVDDHSVATLMLGEFLSAAKSSSANKLLDPSVLGETLAVYGGGNSAIDAARVALRLGVKKVYLIYHRDQACMPGFKEELDEALNERVQFLTLRSIAAIHNRQLTLNVNELDANLRPKATGATEALQVDSLVLALGHQPDPELFKDLAHSGAHLQVDASYRCEQPGIWAIGDLAGGACNASAAIGSGWMAALDVHSYLIGGKNLLAAQSSHAYDAVNPKVFSGMSAKPRAKANMLGAEDRLSFNEVVSTLDDAEAISEASRCYSCGSCRTCGNCVKTCPAKAISFQNIAASPVIARHPVVDKAKCIGCGACTKRCPCGVLSIAKN